MHPERYLNQETKSNHTSKSEENTLVEIISPEIPDTCILFQRYLESGRMINVYDWYESFAGTLNGLRLQKRRKDKDHKLKAKATRDKKYFQADTPSDVIGMSNKNASHSRGTNEIPASPLKGKGRTRGKKGIRGLGRRRGRPETITDPVSSADEAEERETEDEFYENEEARGRWNKEVQARFLRAVQELDFMGFIKHTRRKTDHVQKTVYDVPELT